MGKIIVVEKGGRITIPEEMRQKLGMLPGTWVKFELEGDNVIVIKPVKAANEKPNGGIDSQ